MTSYKLTLQFGDFIFFQREFTLTQSTYYSSVSDINLKTLQSLLPTDPPLPQLITGIPIDKEAKLKKINTLFQKLYYIRSQYINYYIDLQNFTSFDDYLSKFSAKTRNTLKRKVRKSVAKGFTHKIYTSISDVDKFHEYACLVGNRTYQKKCFNASIPSTNNFRRSLMKQAKEHSFLGLILFFQNKPCAYLYCPIIEGEYRYTYLGYLQEYSEYSPGTVLQFRILEHIYSMQLTANRFDFTEGDGAHKKLFATNSQIKANCLIIENSITNQLWLRTQIMIDKLSKLLGRLLYLLKIKKIVKRIIRSN